MYDATALGHHGVKGMKWGVRRDEELLARIGGKRLRGEDAATKAKYKEYKKTTSRKERKADRREVRESRARYLIEEAGKTPTRLFVISTPQGLIGMQGKEFIEKLSLGMPFDSLGSGGTDIFLPQSKKK